jgi:hypothetical protein
MAGRAHGRVLLRLALEALVAFGRSERQVIDEDFDGRDVAQIIKKCRQKKVPWPIDFALYLARALLEAGADVNALTSFSDQTPLFIARFSGAHDVAQVLADAGGREF